MEKRTYTEMVNTLREIAEQYEEVEIFKTPVVEGMGICQVDILARVWTWVEIDGEVVKLYCNGKEM